MAHPALIVAVFHLAGTPTGQAVIKEGGAVLRNIAPRDSLIGKGFQVYDAVLSIPGAVINYEVSAFKRRY